MHQCFKMFNQCFGLCSNHSKSWRISSSFKFDCVAGIQFYLKVVLCWIFSQPTAILSEAGHTNDCQQLKLACILSGYEGDWLAWNSSEGLNNFQAINSRLPPMEKIRRWSLRLWQQNKNIVQLFCKIRLHFPLFCFYSLIVFYGIKVHGASIKLFCFETFLKTSLQKFSKCMSTWDSVLFSDWLDF